jgi:hypothetical protein
MSRGREAEAEGYFRFAGFLVALRFLAPALPPNEEIRARSALLSLANPTFVGLEENGIKLAPARLLN